MCAIDVRDLGRIFRPTTGVIRRRTKEIVALDGLTLQVQPGEFFGLLGPNGAGKTTTIKILTTLLLPTSGTARILDLDVVTDARRLRPRIGFVLGGERGLYWRVNARDNLRYFGQLYRVPPDLLRSRIESLLEVVGLRDRADERVEGYSRGMKQRLHLARMLLHDPEVLFLDEPTIGLDPVGAREVREVVRQLHQSGKTIVLTTHYMFEADELCDRIAVVSAGRIVAEGTPAHLKTAVADLNVVEIEVFGESSELVERLRSLAFVKSSVIEQRDLRQVLCVHTSLGEGAIPQLIERLRDVRMGRIAVREATLEDAYVRLIEGASR